MASITLKDIPEYLHRKYKEQAKRNNRSLQAEIYHVLEQKGDGASEFGPPLDPEDFVGSLNSDKDFSDQEIDEKLGQSFKEKWKRDP